MNADYTDELEIGCVTAQITVQSRRMRKASFSERQSIPLWKGGSGYAFKSGHSIASFASDAGGIPHWIMGCGVHFRACWQEQSESVDCRVLLRDRRLCGRGTGGAARRSGLSYRGTTRVHSQAART